MKQVDSPEEAANPGTKAIPNRVEEGTTTETKKVEDTDRRYRNKAD
jgi:hypothetical protein